MTMQSLRKTIIYNGFTILLLVFVSSCNSKPITSVQTGVPKNSSPSPTDLIFQTDTPIPLSTVNPGPNPSPESTSKISPSQTITLESTKPAIKPSAIEKDMLMMISEDNFLSIGILLAGENNPQILLREPHHSYERPVWSHSGNWVAFRQADYGINTNQIGIIKKNGTERKILSPTFSLISPPNWSSNDQLLGAWKITENGVLPFVIDIETEKIIDLLPNRMEGFSRTLQPILKLSPNTMQGVFIGFVDGNPERRELWLLNLDGNNQHQLILPSQYTTGCNKFRNIIEWSPAGDAFLIELYETGTNNGCRASLWLYDLQSGSWSQVIQQQRIPSDSLREGVYWSPDNQWVAWARFDGAYIYSPNNWELQRFVDFLKGWDAETFLNPWVVDNNGNEIFTIYRDFSITGITHTNIEIWGISPNGTEADDKLLFKVEANEPPGIPIGSLSPVMWSP